MKRIFLITLFITCIITLHAQNEPNMKFGKPADWEMNMTSYADDPDATAVVLCRTEDVRYVFVNQDVQVFYDIKLRIKVLKDEGKEYATMEIPYFRRDDNMSDKEDITGLKATAYNMTNGKVEKTKMPGSMVFDERVDKDYMVKKITVPQVKAGTVFEVQYTKESGLYYRIDTWYAQCDIPVLYTSYEMNIPKYFRFDIDQTGQQKMQNNYERVNMTIHMGNSVEQTEGDKYTFIGQHLPALKSDDYIWSKYDYCNKVFAELRGYEFPGAMYKYFTSNWEEIDKLLLKDEDFGGRLRRSNPLKEELIASGAIDATDVNDKVAKAFTALRQRLRWDGKYKLYGRSSHNILKDGTGSNADLNFILINMLEDAGVQAFPVVMSSRDNGRLPYTHPSIKALNTFVVGFMANDTTISYIDASSEDGFINVLPANLLVDRARAIQRKKDGFWVNLQNLPISRKVISIEASLNTDGTVDGTITTHFAGNAASSQRKSFREAKDSTAFVNTVADKYAINISSYHMDGRTDFSNQIRETIDFTMSCDATSDMIYVNPSILSLMKKPLFTDETRLYPVEFPYQEMTILSSKLTIPEGYTVEEIPENVRMKNEDGSIGLILTYQIKDNTITSQLRFTLKRILFGAHEYEELKQFFDAMVQKCNSMAVLKKVK